MGKLVFAMMQSLDGYVAGVDGGRNCRHRAMRCIVISTIMSIPSSAACTAVACTR